MKIRMLFNSGNDNETQPKSALNLVFAITMNHKLNSFIIALIQIENFNYFPFVRIVVPNIIQTDSSPLASFSHY